MKEKYIFRQAREAEIDTVFALILSRMAWMDEIGVQLWNATKYDERYPRHYYKMRRQRGELFVLEDTETGEIVCVGGLMGEDDRWKDGMQALYLHHFASRPDCKGAGSIFLKKAEQYAREQGVPYFRLDSAVGNEKLEAYYGSRGYVPVGGCKDGLYVGILRQKKL